MATILGHPPVSSGELTPDNLFHIVVGAAFLVAGLRSPGALPARPTA